MLPTFAVLTINQEWSFYIELLGFAYKPWRLFLVICAIPNVICILVLSFVIPESPKFTFARGDEEATLKILRKIYCMNTGKSAQSFEVKSIIKDSEFMESARNTSKGFLQYMWSSTVPLFQGSHLRNILTASFIQFSVCNATNGFWTFLPEILNKITLWNDASRGSATVCEIFSAMNPVVNQTDSTTACIQKLELDTYVYIFMVVGFYLVGYATFSLIINWTGKLVIIVLTVFAGGISAFLLIFVTIPTFSSYLYLIMLLAGLTISVVHASTVELFPTSMRYASKF